MHCAPTMAIKGENMKYNPDIHHRRSIRLKGYDYSQAGLYFITICTQNRLCLFGEIVDDDRGTTICALNENGRIAEKEWIKTSRMRPNIRLDVFVIMPNHMHGIIEIADCRGTMHRALNGGGFTFYSSVSKKQSNFLSIWW